MKNLVISSITCILLFLSINQVNAAENEYALNSFQSLTQDEFNPAWYLDYSIEPSQQEIDGVPLSQVSDELTHIELLSCDNNQYFSQEQCKQIEMSGGMFETVIDLDGDGRMERWRTGVAKKHTGEIVNILLIQNHDTNAVLKIMTLHGNSSGFSVFYYQDGFFMWSTCMSCDVFADITWGDSNYKLMWDSQLAAL